MRNASLDQESARNGRSRAFLQTQRVGLALTGLVLLLVAAGWGISQYGQSEQQRAEQTFINTPGVQRTTLQATTFGPGAQGTIYANREGTRALLLVAGAKSLSPNRIYEVWLLKGSTPIGAGTFTVDSSGAAHAWLNAPQALANYQVSAISEEPQGGSPQPTGGIILFGQFSPP